LTERSQEEKAEEQACLMRQGAGNYSNLCGVLAGFVAVIMVLVLTPGFFPTEHNDFLVELVVSLFTVSSIGYVFSAFRFIGISHMALWEYKSLEEMERSFDFAIALMFLSSAIFLGGVAALAYARGALLLTITAFVAFLLLLIILIKNTWALAKRPPPKKQTKTNRDTGMSDMA
jgi:amino acid transporter